MIWAISGFDVSTGIQGLDSAGIDAPKLLGDLGLDVLTGIADRVFGL